MSTLITKASVPFSCNRTVQEILHALTSHLVGFIQGADGDAFTDVVDSIYSMITPARDLLGTIDGNDRNTVTDVVDSIYSMIKPAIGLSGTIDGNDRNTVTDVGYC